MAMRGFHNRQTGYEPDRFGAFQAPLHRDQNSECGGLQKIQFQSLQQPAALIRRGTTVAGHALKPERILVPFDIPFVNI